MATYFKDVFISYGRRESLAYVGKMHRALKLAGFDGWFDKVNIPDGEDYALQIANGIENAQNFIYIMAPRCLKSPYCLIELEQARYLGKRVIPVNQLVIFDCDPKPLSEGDKGVMIGFYKHYNLPDQNIQTEQDVLRRTHELLGRTDWVYSREEISEQEINELFDWQAKYENYWKKHDDLDYLEKNPLPQFGKVIDPFEPVIDCIIELIGRHKEYVYKHGLLLHEALEWQKHQKSTQYLLVGNERKEAEAWLLREFKAPNQPPCSPSILHIELITESKKNAENLYTDVFISYSRLNTTICTQINRSLMRHCVTTWVDLLDIEKGGDYVQAIYEAIEKSANFIFLMTEESVKSIYCLRELRFALSLNKHVVPLLISQINPENIPAEIRGMQYIDFTDNEKPADYENDISNLLNTIRSEQAYFDQHRTYFKQAKLWGKSNKSQAFLLRGFNLDNAWNWLRVHGNRENYAPLPIHHEFIQESYNKRGQLETEVFVSYSRKDADFARKLNLSLQQNGKTTWFDQESIAEGSDFDAEIFKGILQAENFLFIISPDALASPFCERELIFAAQNGKRFVPILWRDSDGYRNKLPEAFKNTQWIDFKNRGFDVALQNLLGFLETDREHIHAHTKWQIRADEWLRSEKSSDYFLNISACEKAENWLIEYENLKRKPNPAPTNLQKNFIEESRKVISVAQEKEKKVQEVLKSRLKIAKIVSGIAAAFLIVAIYAGVQAYLKQIDAEKSAKEAETAKNLAENTLKELKMEKIKKLELSSAYAIESSKEFDYAELAFREIIKLDPTRKDIETLLADLLKNPAYKRN